MIELRPHLPSIEIGLNDKNELVLLINKSEMTIACESSLRSLFIQGSRQHIGRVVQPHEIAEILGEFLHMAFLTAAMQGRYVRDSSTGTWDVTLN